MAPEWPPLIGAPAPKVHLLSLATWNHRAVDQTSGANAEVNSHVPGKDRVTPAELGLVLGFIILLVTVARSMTVCTPSYRGWMDWVALLAGALAVTGGVLSVWGAIRGPKRLLGALGVVVAAMSILVWWVYLTPICPL